MGVTIEIRVRPNSSRDRVGGVAGDPARLIVAVTAPAVEGKANAGVIKALANALDVRSRDISIVFGELSRDKRVVVIGDDLRIEARVAELKGTLL